MDITAGDNLLVFVIETFPICIYLTDFGLLRSYGRFKLGIKDEDF